MNIALPALALLSLLLSGYIFLSALDRAENTTLERKPFEASSAGAIFVSLVLNLLYVYAVNCYYPIDFNLWFKIISGSKLESADLKSLVDNGHRIIVFFIFNYAISFCLGKIVQKILFECNPYKSSPLAFDTPWYYELKGKLSDEKDAQIIKLSCLQDLKNASYLYYGILEDFYLDKNGQLDRIVLSDVYRRKLDADKQSTDTREDDSPDTLRFYQVDGDRFILKYQQLANINIEYLYVTEI